MWSFRRAFSKAGHSVPRPEDDRIAASYVARPRVEAALTEAMSSSNCIVVFGPARQGKTTLLSRKLSEDSIVVECRPGFKRPQIYRVILSSLGYAVLVEKKRNAKASTTLKAGIHIFDAAASAEGSVEQTLQPVTVDLKNPSEVALLITRIKSLPWIVLNNFQLLDEPTKSNLLFDLATFAERPSMRIMVVGAWPNRDYLENIEPAIVGKFTYVHVPAWSKIELSDAAMQWSKDQRNPTNPDSLHQLVEMAAGDISLFHSFIQVSTTVASQTSQDGDFGDVQSLALVSLRRGLATKLRSLFAERDSYVQFLVLQPTTRLCSNPAFTPTPGRPDDQYLRTNINPQTNRPYRGGQDVRVDDDNRPQYLEEPWAAVVSRTVNIADFILRAFHDAVQKGTRSIELATLADRFLSSIEPQPVHVDPTRLKAALGRSVETQREALIVPPMLTVDVTGQSLEIGDQRIFIYFQNLSTDDLEELLDSAYPSRWPSPRRRNQISQQMTDQEQTRCIESAMAAVQQPAAT